MMKRLNATQATLSVILLAMCSVGCDQNRPSAKPGPQATHVVAGEGATKMMITIGTKVFAASLIDNATAEAFKAMLPLTLDMDELNGNEKKYDFSKDLPTDAAIPKSIESGDLMIWQRNTLVLFYKSFPTSYNYTQLGKIDDPSGLEAAVGKGSIKVKFELI
jgi:hypothetical protein